MARCIMVHTFLCVLLRIMRVTGARKAKRNALLVFPKKFRARLPRIVAVAAGRIAAVAVGAPTHQRTHHQCHHMELMLLNACQKLMEEVGEAYGRILQEVGGNGGKVLTTVG